MPLRLTRWLIQGNTLTTINLNGTGAATTTIKAITDTALTTIVDTATNGAVVVGQSAAPLSQAGLHVNLGTAAGFDAYTGTAIYVSGAGAVIDAHNNTLNTYTAANIILSATGAGSTVLGGATAVGADGETITVGANGTVTMLQGVAAAAGVVSFAGDVGTNIITVGNNSTVTLGTTSAGAASDTASNIIVAGDTTGMVTINKVYDGHTTVQFFTNAGTEHTGTNVNVASDDDLGSGRGPGRHGRHQRSRVGNNYYAVFNWTDGNTYVIGHTGAAETAVSSSDVVVELTGIHSAAWTLASHAVLV